MSNLGREAVLESAKAKSKAKTMGKAKDNNNLINRYDTVAGRTRTVARRLSDSDKSYSPSYSA